MQQMKQPGPVEDAGIFSLLDIPIRNVSMERALEIIFDAIDTYTPKRGAYEMHFVNAHCINVAAKQSSYLEILKNAKAVFADGSGIRKAGEMLGTPIVDNVNGTDLFPLICERCLALDKQLYLLGSAPGIAEKTAAWATGHVGGDIIAGFHDGFFSDLEAPMVIEQINATKPDILLVAMGVPRQELWLHTYLPYLNVPVCLGVGGLFDFYSGNIPRAPRWMRKVGIEWVWRLLMEPKRMWKRYIIGNVEFLLRIRKIKRNKKSKRLG
jgi:N-acetylglucosaminyldiphosphoundecaprenol N-acetyl-beta-D-mannosaminyltransferase